MTGALGPGAEFDVIRRVLHAARERSGERRPHPLVRVGPGDDCAVIAGLALSCDLSVENVHFRRDWLADEECGYRATAAALSDLAAMTADAIGVLAAVGAPDGDTVERVMLGVAEAASASGAELLGGDVAHSPGAVVIDVLAVGECAAPVLRGGGRAGDELWVTGALGGAAAAVAAWRAGHTPPASARRAFARPQPRIAEAAWLAERGLLTALIDLSDGLLGDASHIAAASGVRAVIDTGVVPVHEAALGRDDALGLALGGGEDYELLLASPAGALDRQAAAFTTRFGLPLTRVGRLEEGAGVRALAADGSPWTGREGGYRHFAEDGA